MNTSPALPAPQTPSVPVGTPTSGVPVTVMAAGTTLNVVGEPDSSSFLPPPPQELKLAAPAARNVSSSRDLFMVGIPDVICGLFGSCVRSSAHRCPVTHDLRRDKDQKCSLPRRGASGHQQVTQVR